MMMLSKDSNKLQPQKCASPSATLSSSSLSQSLLSTSITMKNKTFYNNNLQQFIDVGGLLPFLVLLLTTSILIDSSCVNCLTLFHDYNTNNNNNNHHYNPHEDESKIIHLEGKVGSYAVFNCRVDFPYDYDIPYVVHWSKEGKRIFTWYDGEVVANDLFAGRLSIVENHEDYGKASVNLTAIRESDQGRYHCQILFPNRTPSLRNNGTWYHLTVEGGSLIKIPPINQTIMEGQTAFFHCVMKHPDNSIVTWYKDGEPLNDIPDMKRRSYMGPDGSLSIDPTMMSDLGEYECNIRNTEEEVQTARAFLNIQYKAKVIFSPPEIYLPYGQPAILDCHFRSNPPLRNMRWEKDGLLFDSYNVPGVYYKQNNGSLYFAKVDESFAGAYTCTPYNELGTDGPSPIINVIVQRPPVFTVQPKPVYIHKLGDTIQLTCDAIDRDGNHRPIILWSRKDGIALPNGRHTQHAGNLTIESITESDRGIYECSVTNEAATVTAETEVMIENITPRPPYILQANSTDTEITIRWQPGYIMRPSIEYIVWYRKKDAPEWRTLRISTQNTMEATISNLTPGQKYEFMVVSQDHRDGMLSKLFEYSTKSLNAPTSSVVDEKLIEPEPYHDTITSVIRNSEIGPPINLVAESKSDDGFILKWKEPKYGVDNLQLYVIKWWQEPAHLLHGQAETLNTNYFIRHLKDDEIYRIQVFSLSISGYQIGSNEVFIEVPSHRKMRAVAIGSTVAIIFLITAVSVFIYVKKSCFQNLKSNDK